MCHGRGILEYYGALSDVVSTIAGAQLGHWTFSMQLVTATRKAWNLLMSLLDWVGRVDVYNTFSRFQVYPGG